MNTMDVPPEICTEYASINQPSGKPKILKTLQKLLSVMLQSPSVLLSYGSRCGDVKDEDI